MSYEQIQSISGTAGLILFIVVFIGVVAYTFRPGAKAEHDKHAQIPLNED